MYSDKVEFDKFYTKPNVVETCLSYLNLNDYDLVIEPSAGNGEFTNLIKHDNTISMDIQPQNDNIIQADFLNYTIPKYYNDVLIIGNPPFGKRNVLSKKFLEKSFSYDNIKTVALILPNVYKKYNNQKVIPLEFRISNIVDIGKNCFYTENGDYHVPCSFFIFDKSKGVDLRTESSGYYKCKDFEFGSSDNYDFFIMGASPNTIKFYPEKNNRGYYIKSLIDKNILIERFKNINWFSLSSANGGVAWRTKNEIINCYLYNYPESKNDISIDNFFY